MRMVFYGVLEESPLGQVWVAASQDGVWAVGFGMDESEFLVGLKRKSPIEVVREQAKVQAALEQIGEYLEGQRKTFDLPIDWSEMTDFQEQILKSTREVAFGSTTTYGELAYQVDRPGAARAVGSVQASNPLPLLIPCHRVLGSDGKLHGYSGAGGLETKAWLLKLEGVLKR